jgi:hypothetical protein
MSYCHVSRQIDEHAHGEMVADAFHTALNNRIADLTAKGAEFYPFTRENIGEALGSLSDAQELILQTSLEMELDEIGGMIGNWISQYWTLQAEAKAIKELSE